MAEFSKKTIAERIIDATYTGDEAKFADSDTATVYNFTPEDLRDWLDFDAVTEDIVEDLTNLTIVVNADVNISLW